MFCAFDVDCKNVDSKPASTACLYIDTSGVTPTPETKDSSFFSLLAKVKPATGADKFNISPTDTSSCNIVDTSPSCVSVTSLRTPNVKQSLPPSTIEYCLLA